MLGLLASDGVMSPAHAWFGSGGPSYQIVLCSQNPNSPYGCRGAVYGVSATLRHFSPTLSSWGGTLVQAMYIRQNSANHVEFGWIQTRLTLGYGERNFYIAKLVNGVFTVIEEWPVNAADNTEFTLQIYQLAGSIGTFRFRYKIGPPESSGWTYRSTKYSPGWSSGFAYTAQETWQAEDNYGHHFLNHQIENSAASWLNTSGNYRMEKHSDSEPSYDAYCDYYDVMTDAHYHFILASLCPDVFFA